MTKLGSNLKLGANVKLGINRSFHPLWISDCVVWIDMLDPTAYVENSSGSLNAVINKASSVAWLASTNKPSISASINDRRAIVIDAASVQRFQSTEAAVVNSQKDNYPTTILAVAKSNLTDYAGTIFGVGNTAFSSARTKRYGYNTGGTGQYSIITIDDAGTGSNVVSTTGVVNTAPHIITWMVNGTTASISLDGASVGADAVAYSPGAVTANQVSIGSKPDNSPDSFFDGAIGEVLVYSRALSTAERFLAQSYFSTKWDIPITPITPLTILSGTLLQWSRADQGVTQVAGVSQWDDLSGNNRHWAQATTGSQPTFGATSGPNGTPAITFDGVDDNLRNTTLTRPVPNTTPTWIWIVFKQVTWTNSRRIYSAGNSSSTLTLVQSSPSPGLIAYNAVNSSVNTDLVVGAWAAVANYFSNSTADYIQVNDNAPTTGINLGNNGASTSMVLGAGNNTLYSNIAVAEIVYASALPTADQLAQLAAYRLMRYGF